MKRLLFIFLIPTIALAWTGFNSRVIFTEKISTQKENQTIEILPSGTGEVKLKDYSGLLFWSSGLPSAVSNIELAELEYLDGLSAKLGDPLDFEVSIANNQSDAVLLNLTLVTTETYKIEARITRETDNSYAESVTEFFLVYDESDSSWKLLKETISDLKEVESNVTFNMNSNDLTYSSDDMAGSNYVGKINGKITRL